jgi:hypothetical protein
MSLAKPDLEGPRIQSPDLAQYDNLLIKGGNDNVNNGNTD